MKPTFYFGEDEQITQSVNYSTPHFIIYFPCLSVSAEDSNKFGPQDSGWQETKCYDATYGLLVWFSVCIPTTSIYFIFTLRNYPKHHYPLHTHLTFLRNIHLFMDQPAFTSLLNIPLLSLPISSKVEDY